MMRSPLLVIALVFGASAGLRLATNVPAAFAAVGAPAVDPAATEALIAEIDERGRDLDAREADLEREVLARRGALDARERRIAEAEAALSSGLEELAEARRTLEALLARAEGLQDEDLRRLASVYAAMRPAEAGPLFAVMEPGFAAGFLALMPDEAAAGILAELTPEIAYAISAMAASRAARLGLGGSE